MLNEEYRNGGDICDSREGGPDLVSEMLCVRKRHDILANQLRAMGITENGDDVEDEAE